MSTTVRFRDHKEFQRAAITMAGAGAAAGLAAYLAAPPRAGWGIGLVGGAAVLGALAPTLRQAGKQVLVRVALVACAALALALLPRAGHTQLGVGLFAVLFSGALAWGLSGRRLLVALASGAGVALLARHTLLSIGAAAELSTIPAWGVATFAGAAFSFVSVLALVPRHVDLLRDPVTEAYEELAPTLSGEVFQVVGSAYRVWTEAAATLPEGDPNRQSLRDGVMRVMEVARQWNTISAQGTSDRADVLVARMDELQQRIDATEDEIARGQYMQARAALAEQLRYLKDIDRSRGRVLARMHNYLAALERLRLAVVNLESANASRDASDVQPLVASLEAIGIDIDAAAEVMTDVSAGTSDSPV